jgi:hypothetical protein
MTTGQVTKRERLTLHLEPRPHVVRRRSPRFARRLGTRVAATAAAGPLLPAATT